MFNAALGWGEENDLDACNRERYSRRRMMELDMLVLEKEIPLEGKRCVGE